MPQLKLELRTSTLNSTSDFNVNPQIQATTSNTHDNLELYG